MTLEEIGLNIIAFVILFLFYLGIRKIFNKPLNRLIYKLFKIKL